MLFQIVANLKKISNVLLKKKSTCKRSLAVQTQVVQGSAVSGFCLEDGERERSVTISK